VAPGLILSHGEKGQRGRRRKGGREGEGVKERDWKKQERVSKQASKRAIERIMTMNERNEGS
jgi:hypothetical protein